MAAAAPPLCLDVSSTSGIERDLHKMHKTVARLCGHGKAATMSRQRLELPKTADTREHSAKFAARERPGKKDQNSAAGGGIKNVGELIEQLRHDIDQLERTSAEADSDAYGSLLRRCAAVKCLAEGRRLHRHIADSQRKSDLYVNNLLVLMYGKCESIRNARAVFDSIEQPNAHSWNIMLAAYSQNGHLQEALDLYFRMDVSMQRSSITYCNVLSVCSSLGALAEGRAIHASVVGTLFETYGGPGSVGTALVNMYGKCACPGEARAVFDKLEGRNVVCWNSMISAYAQNERDAEAIELYRKMDQDGMKATEATFVSVVDACSSNSAMAREVHGRVASYGLESDIVIASALVNMYGKCQMLKEARVLFDSMSRKNVFTWSGMIGAYAHNGHGKQALELFRKMDVKPNNVTFVSVLDACSQLGDVETGKEIHGRFTPNGFDSDVVLGNALINMYGKCGCADEAREVFNKMPRRNVITWTSIIAAYAQNGHAKESLELYQEMLRQFLKPNTITVVSILDACANGGALLQGREIHRQLVADGIKPDGVLGNAIVNMYGKCGSLDEAWSVFSNMRDKNVVSWTSIIASYAEHGHGGEAFAVQKHMCLEGVKPDDITFISLLFACSHAGTLEKGWEIFMAMVADYYVVPIVEHYRCMVDLLGRTGRLAEAEELIRNMPFHEDIVSWSTLLGGCRLHSNEEHGKRAADRLLELCPDYSPAYVLLANIYAANGKMEDAGRMLKLGQQKAAALKARN